VLPETIRAAAHLAQALKIVGPDLGRSLLGDADSRSSARCPPSEFALVEGPASMRRLHTLAQLLIPALPRRLPAWARLQPRIKPAMRLLLRPAKVYRYRAARPLADPTPAQAWFFINGIGADREVLMHNAAYLTELFQRPLTLLHNPSCGLLPDLAECTLGKGWSGVSEAARMAFAPVYSALKQPGCERVVLLAHSQGSIVASVLLWLLRGLYAPTADELLEGPARCPEQRVARTIAERWGFPCAQAAAQPRRSSAAVRPPLTREELAKLEIYAFGNCASLMGPIDRRARVPHVESYGNEFDLMAHLGMLAPAGPHPGAYRIGGERFLRRGAWGHLLNAHYLWPMEQEWRALARDPDTAPRSDWRPLPGNQARRPRLPAYFGGESAPALVLPDAHPAREGNLQAGWAATARQRRRA
jgi:hypothetical protein